MWRDYRGSMGMAGRGRPLPMLVGSQSGRPNKACLTSRSTWRQEPAPAQPDTHTLRTFGTRTNRLGYLARFQFDPAVCGVCPLRSHTGRGTVALHSCNKPGTSSGVTLMNTVAPGGRASPGAAGATGGPPISLLRPAWRTVNLTLVATKMGMISPAPGSSHDKPDQQAPGSPIVTTQFILAEAPVTLSLDLQSTGYPPRHPVTAGLFSRVSRNATTSSSVMDRCS